MWKVCAILVAVFVLLIGGARQIGRRFMPVSDEFPLPAEYCWDGICLFAQRWDELETVLFEHPHVLRDPLPETHWAEPIWEARFVYKIAGFDPMWVRVWTYCDTNSVPMLMSVTPDIPVMTLGDLLVRAGSPDTAVVPGPVGPSSDDLSLLYQFQFNAVVAGAKPANGFIHVLADDPVTKIWVLAKESPDPRIYAWHGLGIYEYVPVE